MRGLTVLVSACLTSVKTGIHTVEQNFHFGLNSRMIVKMMMASIWDLQGIKWDPIMVKAACNTSTSVTIFILEPAAQHNPLLYLLILSRNCECHAFLCGNVCCSVDCWTSACVLEHNNKNSDVPVNDSKVKVKQSHNMPWRHSGGGGAV
jgi:hypothetical protein